MSKPKVIKDPVRLSIVVSRDLLVSIKRATVELSVEKGEPISASEVTRKALERAFHIISKE